MARFAILAFSAAVFSAFAVENGTFEFSAAGWSNVSGNYRYDRRAGRNGTGAVVFESDIPADDSVVPEQRIPVESGRIYDFEAWLKPDGLCKPGATVRLSLLRKDGSNIRNIYTGGARGSGDWRRISVRTPRLGGDVAFVQLRLCAWKGATGKCVFDDIDLRLHVARAVGLMKSTAYRDEAFEGSVAFHAETSLDCADGLKAEDACAEFVWKDATGVMRRTLADSFDGNEASWRCDVSAMAYGTNCVVCELKTKDGRVLGSNSLPFARLSAMPKRAVMFDAHGRTLVNGEPFFPLGVYTTPFDTNAIRSIATAGFNCFAPYKAPDRAGLDFCQEQGLKVFYLCRDYPNEPFSDETTELEKERKRLAKRAEMVRSHPAVLAWYINDERPLSMHDRLRTRYRALKELDPEHPVWSVLYQVTEMRGYVDTSDVLGSDPYPVPGPLTMAADWTRLTREASFGTQPVWQVPQAFDWSLFRVNTPSNLVACGRNRVPTLDEMRSMSWQCIAEGANGLIYYSYTALEKMDWKDPFEVKWRELCLVAAEIKRFVPVLLSEPIEIEPVTGLSARAWRHSGEVWLLLCNATGKPVKTAFRSLVAGAKVKLEFGTGVRMSNTGEVEADMPPYEFALFRLTTGKADL